MQIIILLMSSSTMYTALAVHVLNQITWTNQCVSRNRFLSLLSKNSLLPQLITQKYHPYFCVVDGEGVKLNRSPFLLEKEYNFHVKSCLKKSSASAEMVTLLAIPWDVVDGALLFNYLMPTWCQALLIEYWVLQLTFLFWWTPLCDLTTIH